MRKIILSYDEMKKIVLNQLKNIDLKHAGDIERAVEKHIRLSIDNENEHRNNILYDDESLLVTQIIWDLIIERILTIGHNRSNREWPNLRLTEYGTSIMIDEISIHDIGGSINYLITEIPNIDSIIITYYQECLNTYRIGSFLASTVMLGCATEKTILLLYESYIEFLISKENKSYQKLKQSQNKSISKKFDLLQKSIKTNHDLIPKKLLENFDVVINAVSTIIRKNRNQAGHPTGKDIKKEELSSWIQVFRIHCVEIYKLINYFSLEEN